MLCAHICILSHTLLTSPLLSVCISYGISNLLAGIKLSCVQFRSTAVPRPPLRVFVIMFAYTREECCFILSVDVLYVLCETICYSVRRNEGLRAKRCSRAWAWVQPKYFEKSFLLPSPPSLASHRPGARRFPVVFWLFGVNDACWQTPSALSLCIAKFVGGWTRLSACVPQCWVTMSSAGRLADACLMLQIQSCPLCGVSKWSVCVCVCVRACACACMFSCVYVCKGVRKKQLFVLAERSFAKEVVSLPKLTKQTCGSECFICATSPPVVIMERWPFYSSRPPLHHSFVSWQG